MKKGFTLIEVMFSVFILLVGVTAVTKMYGTGTTITRSSGEITYAQNLAKTYLNLQLARPGSILGNAANPVLPTCIDDIGNSFTTKTGVEYNNTTYTVECSFKRNKVGSRTIATDEFPVGFVSVKVSWTDTLNTTNALKKHEIINTGLLGLK